MASITRAQCESVRVLNHIESTPAHVPRHLHAFDLLRTVLIATCWHWIHITDRFAKSCTDPSHAFIVCCRSLGVDETTSSLHVTDRKLHQLLDHSPRASDCYSNNQALLGAASPLSPSMSVLTAAWDHACHTISVWRSHCAAGTHFPDLSTLGCGKITGNHQVYVEHRSTVGVRPLKQPGSPRLTGVLNDSRPQRC